MLEKYVDERTYHLTEEELRKVYTYGSVGIHYAFNDYRNDVQKIIDLSTEVHKDYPGMRNDEMTIWVISDKESIRHAKVTTLFIQIPIEDYLKLRNQNQIGIR